MLYVPRIDEFACMAHGDCVEVAPEVFELDGDIVTVIGSQSELMVAAAAACPSTAISVFDSATNTQIYP